MRWNEMNDWVNALMNEWMNAWMDEWMNDWNAMTWNEMKWHDRMNVMKRNDMDEMKCHGM